MIHTCTTCVLISLALSAYFRVPMEWWYWSEAEDTVVIMAVRLLPLSPSYHSVRIGVNYWAQGLGSWERQ